MELLYKIKQYDWGRKGHRSKVALLYSNTNTNFSIEENQPYAELWIGSHLSGVSVLKYNGKPLPMFLDEHPEYLGDKVRETFGDKLPFLLKVLSIQKSLSIQAHPTKEHAVYLHRNRPDLYKDDNHKPELAIALTPFSALVGFRPLPEIYYFLQNIPELKALIGGGILDDYNNARISSKDMIRHAFKAVLESKKDQVTAELRHLVGRLKALDFHQRQVFLADLLDNIYAQHPDDVGCLLIYFLNHSTLKPFESIYLAPNEPHAYLSGECVECMACSDNVVRAGLTSKYIDSETLVDMLSYKCEPSDAKIFKPIQEDKYSTLFKPPVPDFAVAQIMIPVDKRDYTLPVRDSASTFIIIDGVARGENVYLKPGIAIFLPANSKYQITNVTEDLLLYQAFANTEIMVRKASSYE